MITEGKYLWTIEEDFPLFLKSIFACSNRLLQEIEAKLEKSVREEERLKVQAELTYLLAQQFIDAPEILGHFSETKRKNNTCLLYTSRKGIRSRGYEKIGFLFTTPASNNFISPLHPTGK